MPAARLPPSAVLLALLLTATTTTLYAQSYPTRAVRAGAEVVASSPEAHDKFNRAEIAKWIKVAREAGIQPE